MSGVRYRMPIEGAKHDCTWMAFSAGGYVLGESRDSQCEALRAWSAVANAIACFEPVRMLVDPAMTAIARQWLSPTIQLYETPLDDCWLRDSGPTFVHSVDEGASGVAAVDWTFNGWGAQSWARWSKDSKVAEHVGRISRTPVVHSRLVLEGGGFHVDGQGTAILTETVPLDPHRNPAATKADIEQELYRVLGVEKVVWLPRGLTRDYETFGTRGHVDILATMPAPGVVLVHEQRDRNHPDYQISQRTISLLEQARDARGKQLTVIPVPAPTAGYDAAGPNDYSYINHYVLNGAVMACAFDDPMDENAWDVLSQAYPGRKVVPLRARPLFQRGGGIHCITQQQPSACADAVMPNGVLK